MLDPAQSIILHGLSVSPFGNFIRPNTPPLPIARRPFAENVVFGEDVVAHRHYLGARVQCKYCKARLWIQERVSSTRSNLKFSVCCSQGRVIVPRIVPDLDGLILRLLTGSSPESVHFRSNIRKYNTCHSFASVGAKVDPDLASGKDGVYSYRMQGQMVHLLGSLLASPECESGFAQLYIHDPQEQAVKRNNFCKNQLR